MADSNIQARKHFWAGKEVGDNYVIIKYTFCVFYRGFLRIDIDKVSNWSIFFNGKDLLGNLDTKTKEQFKKKRTGYTFWADVLMVKKNTEKYEQMFNRGYYHYNSHRIKPDSVLAVKIIK